MGGGKVAQVLYNFYIYIRGFKILSVAARQERKMPDLIKGAGTLYSRTMFSFSVLAH
jgi:hypothetical protein